MSENKKHMMDREIYDAYIERLVGRMRSGLHMQLPGIQPGREAEVDGEWHPVCACCDTVMQLDVYEFTDARSKAEFRLSGMCQKCQDSVFGAPQSEE